MTAPWRQGRTVGRTLYDANDQLIGVMDTPALASRVVAAINAAPATSAPCEGFAWVGQSLRHCDSCGAPYWEHTHELKLEGRVAIDSNRAERIKRRGGA